MENYGPLKIFLPQEVCENLIDHLHDDKAALGVCGLVCRAWVPASRYHLFGEADIYLDDDCVDLTRFLELLRTSITGRSIAPYVRKVDVVYEGYNAKTDLLNSLYEALLILRDTTLGYESIALRRVPLNFEDLRKVLPLRRITEVEIEGDVLREFNLFGHLMALFASMPSLQRLLMENIDGFYNDNGAFDGTVLLPQLRTLGICGCNTRAILRPLVTPPMLREVKLDCEDENLHVIGSFLRPLTPYLNEFDMDASYVDSTSSSMKSTN
jgi:hypothetical protein